MNRTARALTLVDVVVSIVIAALLFALAIPTFGAMNHDLRLAASLNNLRQLGVMHATYASDWNGRQWTVTPDDLSVILLEHNGGQYVDDYAGIPGVPPVSLGFDGEGVEHFRTSGMFIQQMWYTRNCSLGSWRAWNTLPFNQYANGKVFDPIFFAPRYLDLPFPDDHGTEIRSYFEDDAGWPGEGTTFWFPSYSMSLAAMVDPDVYRAPSRGGAQAALDLDFGHRSPNLAAVRYPDLKTHMLEQYLLNPPLDDPFIPNTGGVPWFFTMWDGGRPATLFYDGSVRTLPNTEVIVANDIVVGQGGDPLWNEDDSCFGTCGYFANCGDFGQRPWIPPSTIETTAIGEKTPSHHVFTTDGILGRDTIFSGGR